METVPFFADMANPEKMKEKYRDIYKKVANLLLQYDFAGIFFPEHENVDEYNPEVEQILLGLESCKSENEAISLVYNIFDKMFSGAINKDPEQFALAGKEIWSIWNNRK